MNKNKIQTFAERDDGPSSFCELLFFLFAVVLLFVCFFSAEILVLGLTSIEKRCLKFLSSF